MIAVSYIIPLYNGSKTIGRCLNSIYAVGLDNEEFEVIVVDDCSSDDSIEKVKQYAESHQNLRVIQHENNKCQGGAKNTGIRNAKGVFVAFADQDDCIIPSNQKKALEQALVSMPDMLSCKWEQVSEKGDVEEHGLDLADGTCSDGIHYCESWFDAAKCLAPWSYLYRRDFLMQMKRPMEEGVLMEDSDWVAWHLFFSSKVLYMNIPIYRWVMNPNSITHGMSWRHKADYVKFGYRKIRDSFVMSEKSARMGDLMRNDGRYNIEHVFKKLWKIDDYARFYEHVGDDVLEELIKMKWSKRTSFMLHHPKTTCLALGIVGTVLRIGSRCGIK